MSRNRERNKRFGNEGEYFKGKRRMVSDEEEYREKRKAVRLYYSIRILTSFIYI